MNYPDEFVEKMAHNLAEIGQAGHALKLDLHRLAGSLRVPRAKVFLHEGAMRRLGLIEHCLGRIFEVFPPSRTVKLTQPEQYEVTVNIHAFVINVYGVLDNIAWVCALENAFPEPDANKRKIGLFSKTMQPYLPPELAAYVQEPVFKTWFNDYAKIYRDATAHRIAPYLPPMGFSNAEAAKYKELDEAALKALQRQEFDEMQQLKDEQDALGRPLAMVALSVSGEEPDNKPFSLHPQMLCDTLTVHEALKHFASGLRAQHNFPSPRVY